MNLYATSVFLLVMPGYNNNDQGMQDLSEAIGRH